MKEGRTITVVVFHFADVVVAVGRGRNPDCFLDVGHKLEKVSIVMLSVKAAPHGGLWFHEP